MTNNYDTLADRIRDEAAQASRSGQMQRLELIAAEVESLRRGAKTLGHTIEQQGRMVLDVTGRHDLIGEDGDGDWGAVWDHLYEIPMKVLRDAADEMEAVIADGDCAESAAPVSGEVGRSVAVARRDALYEEPHEWLRAYATRLADEPTTTRAATDPCDDEGGVR